MKKIVLLRDFEKKAKQLAKTRPLSVEREQRKQLLHSEAEQRRFEASEQLLMDFLETEFTIDSIEICGAVSEKPYLKGQTVSFSKSYCEEALCLAAASEGNIGVDVETLKPIDEAVVDVFFTRNEKEYLKNSDNKNLAFCLLWTRKESYMKCIGEGMHFRFDLLDVTPRETGKKSGKLFSKNDAVEGLYLNSYLLGNTVLSVCSERNDDFPNVLEK